MLSLSSSLVALAIALAPNAQDVQKPLDFGPATTNAKKLVEDLAKASGVKLEVSGKLQEEILFLEVRKTSLSAVMSHIATATDADWIHDGDAYRLTRSGVTIANQEKKERQARIDRLTRFRQKHQDDAAKLPKWTDERAQALAKDIVDTLTRLQTNGMKETDYGHVQALTDQIPTNRIILGVIATVSVADLASIPPNGRRVFATNPRPSQAAIPNIALNIIREGVRQQAILANAAAALLPSEDLKGSSYNGLMIPQPVSGNSGNLGRALLSVERFGSDDQFMYSLNVTDAAGKQVLTGSTTMYGDFEPTENPTLSIDPKKDLPIEISPLSMEIAKAYAASTGPVQRSSSSVGTTLPDGTQFTLRSSGPDTKSVQLSVEAEKIIVDPVNADPLSILPGEALSSIADRLSVNVVALVPDSAFAGAASAFVAGSPSVKSFLSMTRQSMQMEPTLAEGWLSLKPTEPAKARDQAINRQALRRLLMAMKKNGDLSLDDFSEFLLAQNHDPTKYSFDGGWMSIINASDSGALLENLSSRAALYRLYGSLSPGQRQALASSSMNLGALTATQNRLLMTHLNGLFTNLVFAEGSEEEFPNQLARDKSEIMPNGLPADGKLSFVVKTEQGLLAFDDETKLRRFLTPADFAGLKLQAEMPNLQEFLGQPPRFGHYRVAARSLTAIHVQLRPRVSTDDKLPDPKLTVQGQDVTYEQLPSLLKKDIDSLVESLRQSLKDVGRNGQAPPPQN